ncbi:MAG: 2-hydroxyacyl-CoA dehydratase [Bilophila wadsworthia]
MMDETADPLTELAGRYLDTPCSVMSPNPNRYTALRELTEAFQADAVVDLTWQGCQTYDVESWSVKKFVREELDLPFLQIVTDYSEADTEQLKVRIEAFLEMLN